VDLRGELAALLAYGAVLVDDEAMLGFQLVENGLFDLGTYGAKPVIELSDLLVDIDTSTLGSGGGNLCCG
jgi:hypothetical protein